VEQQSVDQFAIQTLVKQFSDLAEKGASAFLIGFGSAMFVVLAFVDSQLEGATLVTALGAAALVAIAGGALRVIALHTSAQSAAEVKTAVIERSFQSAEKPPDLPPGM
jgi:hypothetical protein